MKKWKTKLGWTVELLPFQNETNKCCENVQLHTKTEIKNNHRKLNKKLKKNITI